MSAEVTSNWEVATACDIRLSSLFGPQGLYGNAYINIDSDVITDIIHDLDPQTPGGELLVIAAHGNSLKVEDEHSKTLDTTRTAKYTAGLTQYRASERQIVASVGLCFAFNTDDEMSYTHLPSQEGIDETVIHELSHSVDAAREIANMLSKSAENKVIIVSMLANIAVGTLTLLDLAKNINIPPAATVLPAMGASFVATNKLGAWASKRAGIRMRKSKQEANAAGELRALAAEVKFSKFSSAITFNFER